MSTRELTLLLEGIDEAKLRAARRTARLPARAARSDRASAATSLSVQPSA